MSDPEDTDPLKSIDDLELRERARRALVEAVEIFKDGHPLVSPPNDHRTARLRLERDVLGAILLSGRIPPDVLPCWFKHDHHAEICASIWRLEKSWDPVSILSVYHELKKADRLDRVGGAGYIAGLVDGMGVLTEQMVKDLQNWNFPILPS